MTSHLVVSLVNSGHDDVAYNLVQYTVDQSTEEGGRRVSEEFLQQIGRCVFSFDYKYFELVHIHVARVERPVTKLFNIVNDMAEKKLLRDGLDKLVNITIDHKNLAQSYTLFDFLLTEGCKIKKNCFSELLKLARSQL